MGKEARPKHESPDRAMHPGDVAPPGTPGTGEAVCPDCKGGGRIGGLIRGLIGGRRCETCGGTGRVVEGIGGA